MLEKTGWLFLSIVGFIYLIALIVAFVAAFPVGVIGLLALAGFGFIFAQVFKDRLTNTEDDYYSKNVHQ